MSARPDERAAAAEIERDRELRGTVGKGVKTAVALAGGALGARLLPFLSEFVPVDLAMKGIDKVAPKIGDFLRRGQKAGLNVKEGMEFVKSHMKTPESEERNLIQKYSPELHQFISEQIKSGRSPLQAGALAQSDPDKKNFGSIISKITKENKATWADILQNIYGQEGAPQQGTPQPPPPPPQGGPGQTQQTQQAGPGQQAFMALLQKINQRLGQ